jgi:carbon storage regulator
MLRKVEEFGKAFSRSCVYACQTGVWGSHWSPCRQSKEEGCSKLLVLTRKSNQSIMIGDDIEISVLSVMGEKVRIGIQAPQEVPVFRKEIYLEIHREDAEVPPAEGATAEVDDALREMGES